MSAKLLKAVFLVVLCILLGGLAAFADDKPLTWWDLKDVKPGMKGYGITTFHGHKIESFKVEVTGIETDEETGFPYVGVRLSGGPNNIFKDVSVFQGISGSPVYIDGILLGAVSAMWPGEKVPVGRVTPFGLMYKGGTFAFSNAALAPQRDISPSFSPQTPSRFWTATQRPDIKIEPGSSVAVAYVVGDLRLSTQMTVTAVDGNRIYGAGHEIMNGAGPVDAPMWRADVAGVVPNYAVASIARDASWEGERGRIIFDGQFGVYGIIGEEARTIPYTLNIAIPGHEEEHFHCGLTNIDVPKTAEHIAAAVLDAFPALQKGPGISFKGKVNIPGYPDFRSEEWWQILQTKKASDSVASSRYFKGLAQLYARKGLSFSLEADIQQLPPDTKFFRLESATLAKSVVNPGEKLDVTLLLVQENPRGTQDREQLQRTIQVQIPKNYPSGQAGTVLIGTAAWKKEEAEEKRTLPLPSTLKEEIARLNNLPPNLVVETGEDSEDAPTEQRTETLSSPEWQKVGKKTAALPTKPQNVVLIMENLPWPEKSVVSTNGGKPIELAFQLATPKITAKPQKKSWVRRMFGDHSDG